MIRFLIFAILAYLIYHVLKGFLRSGKEIDKTRTGGVIDEMVKDPFCEIYIPRRESIRKVIEGQELFFCSQECAGKYLEERRRKERL